jgi:hypothetical protein
MNKQKLVYVASPVRAVFDRIIYLDEAQKMVITIATNGCRAVRNAGHIPISPVLMFNGVYDEYKDRKAIDAACEAILKLCDEIHVEHSVYTKFSAGIKTELILAKKYGLTEVDYTEAENE